MRRGGDGKLIFSPSDLVTYFNSPYISWLNHWNLTVPDAERVKRAVDMGAELLARKGDEFERVEFNKMKSFGKIVEIDKTIPFDQSVALTIEAMKDGADVIYQGAFQFEEFSGYSDFVRKVPGKSKLGNYSYEIYDTKLSQKAKPAYAIQINCYSEMLAQILGQWPERWHLILGDGSVASFPTSDYRYYYQYFKTNFLQFHKTFDAKSPPFPEPWESVIGYEDHIEEKFKAVDHICMVAGMGRSQIRSLNESGIKTRADLAFAADKVRPRRMQPPVFERLRDQAGLQLKSEKTGELAFRILDHSNEESRGLSRLPDADEGDVMFDMEGDPFAEGGLEYLFGVYYLEKGKWVFKDWRAPGASQEKEAFCGFVDWVIARYKKFPSMHIYHYANYEKAALADLSNKHSCKIAEVDTILANNLLVDLFKVVREGVRVGSESYSIKKLEPLYKFKRKSEVTNAGDSVVQFNLYQDLKLVDAKAAQKIFDDIVEYNLEDVASTLGLLEWLRKQKAEHEIEFVPPSDIEQAVRDEKPWESIGGKLVESPPKWLKTDEQKRVNEIVAGIAGFFHREERPVYWRFFNREDSLEEDLYQDPECLALARVEESDGETAKLSFNVEQPLKIKLGDEFCLYGLEDPFKKVEILELDLAKGTATISLPSDVELIDEISLIPGGPIFTKNQKKILQEMAASWAMSGEKVLTSAALDVLYRRPPTVQGIKPGAELYGEKETPLDAALRIALNLQSSALSVQGPPGTGKTFTAATVICHLLKAGKRVAVVSQGKKTVENLLVKVHEQWSKLGFEGKCPSILMADKDAGGAHPLKICKYMDNGQARKNQRSYRLVGGTHWTFAHSDMAGAFDYLFIDEAGQFSLAAAIACSYCAKNLILLGDQMQLEQVNVGVHPSDSGLSVLNYYMNGKSTVERTHGVFLDQTRRMHPQVCGLISELVYDKRLSSHESTFGNQLELPSNLRELLGDGAGIRFVEVHHEGNSTRSEEEAERIVELIRELVRTDVPDGDGKKRKFRGDSEDLIVVAPYNSQVELIRSMTKAKVGSVDLFQGQEAWVSVLSMCASGEEGLHRGLEFLLSRNRLNVGLSRAKALSIVVGSPRLLEIRPGRMSVVALLNFYAALMGNVHRERNGA